ncbi:hypothetical protein BDZ94DRAFT_1255151 [Collybia nuda]|uniref:DASH complex subunit DUO1 n=1 Tax=Collybia nuda TaxID=64659 RepID=A0A9P5Y813_9AGAR|nr:hypothetical protein BDZ94DRAFT_1255151 [Collybia nuda]
MFSPDSSDIVFPENENESRLLSESPILLSSHTGPGGDDLSISELSLPDRTAAFDQPFTLLAPSQDEPTTPTRSDSHDDSDPAEAEFGDGYNDDVDDFEQSEQEKRLKAKAREEKLQSDIFILRKLNASFASFNEALQDTRSANQRVAMQLEQTDALLNKYIHILSTSEDFAKLILDEQWQGAEEDEGVLERERVAQLEKERREAEEQILAAQREREQREKEERERMEQEERDRIEREKREKATTRGGIRGVRGTRASMRGTRGTTRTGSTGTTAGRPNSISAISSGNPSKLPTATGGVRTSTMGPSTRVPHKRT